MARTHYSANNALRWHRALLRLLLSRIGFLFPCLSCTFLSTPASHSSMPQTSSAFHVYPSWRVPYLPLQHLTHITFTFYVPAT